MDALEEIKQRIESFLFPAKREKRSWIAQKGFEVLRVLYLAVRKSGIDNISFKAYALTYITALSIVPILAMTFSVAKGFGASQTLRSFVAERMTGVQSEVLDKIFQYVQNTNVGTLGAVGLAFVLYSVVMTLSRMELAFNQIWNVSDQRPFLRKFTYYTSLLLICPFLLLVATGFSASLQSNALVSAILQTQYVGGAIRFFLSFGSYFTLWVAFTVIYLFLPNTRVPARDALISGVIAGTMWILVQRAYITFQVGVSKYNAIYGTFASLPMFLIWLYISWVIMLFGAELCWTLGGSKSPQRLKGFQVLPPSALEDIAVRAAVVIGRQFYEGKKPLSAEEIGRELAIDFSIMEPVLNRLRNAGIVSFLAGESPGCQPARSMQKITIQEVVAAVNKEEAASAHKAGVRTSDRIATVLDTAHRLSASELSKTTLNDLVTQGEERSPAMNNQPQSGS
jgi:membrane protein